MTPAEPPKLSTDSAPTSKRRGEWFLTQEAFDKLLSAFSPDRDEAASQYEALRIKLIRFFEWRSVTLADNRADETLNRVARRIDEGQQVVNVAAYAHRVAYLIFLEAQKEPEVTEIDLDRAPRADNELPFADNERELRQQCFDLCLEHLSGKKRSMLLDYYEEERQAKIERRKKLADQLKISLDALRIRVHRIRKGLEECIINCLRQQAPTRNTTR
jgi:DNA-directed RNA polymerase specialized sigma24 family protein